MLKINPIKVSRKVNCSADPFKIPVSCENTTSFSASRSLQAAINRSGTLQAEHYWSFKRNNDTSKWFFSGIKNIYCARWFDSVQSYLWVWQPYI